MIELRKFSWMIKKELLSLKRHPPRLISILIFPIIMILLFGYGMGGDMTDLPVVVVSQSHGDLTDVTLDTIKTTDQYKVVEVMDDVDDAKERVDSGEVKAAIILPENYGRTKNGLESSLTQPIVFGDAGSGADAVCTPGAVCG